MRTLADCPCKLVGAVSIPHGLPHSTTLVVKEIYILSAVCGLWRAVRYGNRTYGLAYATTLVVEMFSTLSAVCGLWRAVRYGNRTYGLAYATTLVVEMFSTFGEGCGLWRVVTGWHTLQRWWWKCFRHSVKVAGYGESCGMETAPTRVRSALFVRRRLRKCCHSTAGP
jgi:hypothetical protein